MMHSVLNFAATFLALTSTLTVASPLVPRFNPFPLPDGFPTPTPDQLKQIEQKAFGTLPNATPPPKISPDGQRNLRVIAVNELFEVAFFTELIANITNKVHGYEINDSEESLIRELHAAVAQEELHALNANGALRHFGQTPIAPCSYQFPVDNLKDAITLASVFTSVVLGTLQDVINTFATNGDAGLAAGVASVVGQEGEQEGFFRLTLNKVPSELPFLTRSTIDFAVNALNQNFIVPGSCQVIDTLGVKTFQPLTVLTPPQPKTQPIQFRIQAPESAIQGLSLAYINQQNVPIVEKITLVKTDGPDAIIEANFPYDANLLNGLTIAALTNGAGPFANAQAVANATEFGPGLIVVH